MLQYNQAGEGPNLLLIHGFPNDLTTWDPVMPAFIKQFRVTRLDLPGAGKSLPMPAGRESMEYMADQILDTLDALGIDETLVAGHSMGGYAALELYSLAPERITGLALVHSLASADTEEKKVARQKSIKLLHNGSEGKRVFLEAMAQNLFGKKDSIALQAQVVANGMKSSAEALAAFYTAIMHRTDKRPMLAELACPIAFLCGTEDNATPYALALEECTIAPLSMLHTLRCAGHMSMLENPEWLVDKLLKFFAFCRE